MLNSCKCHRCKEEKHRNLGLVVFARFGQLCKAALGRKSIHLLHFW